MRVTTRLPAMRKVHGPNLVDNYRNVVRRGEFLFGRLPRGLDRARVDDGGVAGEWVFRSSDPVARKVVYFVHGCGYVAGSPSTYRTLTSAFCRCCDARVFALDYRLAPEHRFPAALHDALAGYRRLLCEGIAPRDIVIAGDSAGGGLALSTLIALRDEGAPLPAGAVLIAPWVDLAAPRARDAAQHGQRRLAQAYVGEGRLDDPLASALYGDLHGLPPMLIQASSSETLVDDAVRLHAKARDAGLDASLRLWDDVPHVWHIFAGLRETREAFADIAAFVARVTS